MVSHNPDRRDFFSNDYSVTAVASGAVLRALNKKNGPTRHAECSFGFLRWEPQQPEIYQSHSQNRNMAVFDPDDGETYIQVINYFMIKVCNPPGHSPSPS